MNQYFAKFRKTRSFVLSVKGLSQEIYDLFTRLDLPLYQWTWIDVFSRLRFVAYSYEHSWTNGRIFFQLVTSWLRLFGIRKTLNCSIDGGTEWHANHERSFVESLDNFYQPLGLNMSVIRKGHPEDNAFVERSHRTDDEEFYVPMGKYIKGERSFQKTIQWWQLFYNTQRRHQGIGNKTPIQQLKTHNDSIHPAIAHFPPIILDRHLNCMPGGQNVFDYYLAFFARLAWRAPRRPRSCGLIFARTLSIALAWESERDLPGSSRGYAELRITWGDLSCVPTGAFRHITWGIGGLDSRYYGGK